MYNVPDECFISDHDVSYASFHLILRFQMSLADKIYLFTLPCDWKRLATKKTSLYGKKKIIMAFTVFGI